MATNARIFRINYKSDFILTLKSDAGWMTPFCIKFWTGAPSQAYYVGWDGNTYNHCSFDPNEPRKLQVQFDDHHLPIGDLKFQVAYHFTVADFPDDTEDEVINAANITTEIDGDTYQVMLDFTGETAPEIEFSLPAYANEAQRIANEQQRIAAETQRIANEQTRINQEQTRQQNEQQRINQEQARVNEYASLKDDAVAATGAANDAAALATQKAQLAADKAALADAAATLANQKAQLAADKAALAASAAQLANDKAALAQQKAEYAQTQGGYAKDQGDYAKEQGDYAKAQGDTALADHRRAESDHGIAIDDHTQAGNDHTRAESDHGIAVDDHTQAGTDHTTAQGDHTTAGNDHTTAQSDHTTAGNDHTQAGTDHTRAEYDHTRAESDHAAVEVYSDSLGPYDISAAHASGGVLATYANLSAALGTNGSNIPEGIRKGGMSVKYVQSSDNKYVQYRLMATSWSTNVTDWQGVDTEPMAGSDNLVKSGGVAKYLNLFTLEQGGYKAADGTKITGNNRVRSTGFILSPFSIEIDQTSDIEVYVIKYNLDGSFNAKTSWSRSRFYSDNTLKYTIMFRYSDDSNITPSNVVSAIGTDIHVIFSPNDWDNYLLGQVTEQGTTIGEHTTAIGGIEDDIDDLQDDIALKGIVFDTITSANLHNSATATPATSSEPTDGSDWLGHIISTTGSPSASTNYTATYYIPVEYGVAYKCNVSMRRAVFYNSNHAKISYVENVEANTSITIPENAAYIRFGYATNISSDPGRTPASVKFGKYTDNIDVPYGTTIIDKDSYGRRISLKTEVDEAIEALHNELTTDIQNVVGQKIITSVGSSGLDVGCGGQYCLTDDQKTAYGVTNDLTVTKVLQVLLGYDTANVCAYSGHTASGTFFKNGSIAYILKNSVTLISGTAVSYTWNTTNIGCPTTASLSSVDASDVGTFDGVLNGYNVEVNASSGTIKLTDTTPANVTIPAGAFLYRSPKTRTTAGSGTVTRGLYGTEGLLLQVGANSEGATPDEIVNYCEIAIKESNCKWFLVLRQNTQGSLDYDTCETTGSTDLNKAAAKLRAKYGSRFIDHMAYMTSRKALSDQGITPTTSESYPDENGQNSNPLTATQIEHNVKCDMQCIAERILPSSFWYGAYREDGVETNSSHMNAQGLECLGKYLYMMLQKLGVAQTT